MSEQEHAEFCIHTHVKEDQQLHSMVDNFFSLESLGIRETKTPLDTVENMRAMAILEATVQQLDDGSYEAGLLWRRNNTDMPNSKPMAIKRWMSLEKSLQKKPNIMTELLRQIHEYKKKGYLQPVKEEENELKNTWYLPIFPVLNPNKPGKVRIVWDAAAEVQGVSLNSYLLAGPDLNATLIEILSKFRECRYAVGGDIEQMFHQVKIRAEDQNFQRCIWRDSPQAEFQEFKMVVITFGVSCFPCTSNTSKTVTPRNSKSSIHVQQKRLPNYTTSMTTWTASIPGQKPKKSFVKSSSYTNPGAFEYENSLQMTPE